MGFEEQVLEGAGLANHTDYGIGSTPFKKQLDGLELFTSLVTVVHKVGVKLDFLHDSATLPCCIRRVVNKSQLLKLC